MLFSFLSTVAVLGATVVAQIPPSFTPSAATQLGVAYGATKITPGQQLAITVPVNAPTIGVNTTLAASNSSSHYLVFMIDPDAPTPSNASSAQILHWMAGNWTLAASTNGTFPLTFSNSSPAAIPYRQPAPPVTSTAHRYIQYLFAQPANFSIPAAFAGFSATNRSNFNISAFASAAHLGSPLAANYFLTSNMTANATGTAGAPATTTTKPAAFTGAASNMQALWSAGTALGMFGVVAAFAL